MKKTHDNRYPHSATLFKFCKHALETRYDGSVKVIDQDVGAILGYDPADCSHWKKGKKNIRALKTIRNIADHLKIDERVLIDIASGKVSLDEAIFEFKGYGDFSISQESQESFKKDFFQNSQLRQSTSKTFEQLFNVQDDAIKLVASNLLNKGNFKETPLYLPEIFQLVENLELKTSDTQEEDTLVHYDESTKTTTVTYKKQEIKPYLRFIFAKEVFCHLLKSKHQSVSELIDLPKEVNDIHANLFAAYLLIPNHLLVEKVDELDCSYDIVNQLSEWFWVSKALMNKRLRKHIENIHK